MSSLLESLPPELLVRLVESMSRPSDLKALCLTSRTMRVPATTQLYTDISVLDAVHEWTSHDLSSTVLAASNPGIGQIRKIWFNTVSPEEQPDADILAKVLKALPKDGLRGFDCSQCAVDEDTMVTLMTRQHKLASLGLGPLVFNPMPFLHAGLLDISAFTKLKSLDIPQVIGSQHDLELYQLIIEKAPLRRLAIGTSAIESEATSELDDKQERDGLISRILFKHIRDAQPNTRIQLDILYLEELDLALSDRTFSRYFDWSELKELDLWRCLDAGNLIKSVTQHFTEHGTQLKRFYYTSAKGVRIDSSVLEAFLASCEGLTHLTMVGVINFSLLNLDTLARHSDCLEWLSIHPHGSGNRGSGEMGMGLRFFAFVAKCRKLRQVALPLPRIDLPKTPNDFAMCQSYKKALLTLLDLPDLKSLRVYSWPLPNDQFIDCDMHDGYDEVVNARMYVHDLDYFVTSYLGPLFARSKAGFPWPILCFNGLSDCVVSDSDVEVSMSGPQAYVLVRYLSLFGQIHSAMQNNPLRELQYMEPESQILR